jgi:predicted transcriptional regulator
MTVLDNLRRKGMVSREKDGRAYRYRPRLTREEHTATLIGQILAIGDNREAALLHFVRHLPADEVARLREALDVVTDRGSGPR